MVWTILIVGIFLLISFAIFKGNKKNTIEKTKSQLNLDVPNPETANPKKVIHFISNYEVDVVKQVYKQLKDLNIRIPINLDKIFKEKIDKGYIFREEYYWGTSIEDFQNIHENLYKYKDTFRFELKGLHITSYKKRLKDCIIYDKVTLNKEPHNKYDKNAIKVVANSGLIGYVPAEETEKVHQLLEREHKVFIEDISDIDGYIDATIKIYYN